MYVIAAVDQKETVPWCNCKPSHPSAGPENEWPNLEAFLFASTPPNLESKPWPCIKKKHVTPPPEYARSLHSPPTCRLSLLGLWGKNMCTARLTTFIPLRD